MPSVAHLPPKSPASARLGVPGDAAAELVRALDRLDRSDRVWYKAAGFLLCRRPRGADRLVAEIPPLARRVGQVSQFVGWWPTIVGRMAKPA